MGPSDLDLVTETGAASVDVTPDAGVAMQGYGRRTAVSVSDSLFAGALAVGNDRLRWILLTVDAIGLDRQFVSSVRRAVSRRLNIEPSNVTIACSHTHSGPATLRALGPVSADQGYLKFLRRRLVDAAVKAATHRDPARWRFGLTSVDENVNRRAESNGDIVLGVNRDGPADKRLRVVRIDRCGGPDAFAPLALIVQYACHATTSGGGCEISADWPGAMKARVGDYYAERGPRPVVCFLQGCTGDVTHRIGRDSEAWPRHLGQHTTAESRILGQIVGDAAVDAGERSEVFDASDVRVVATSLRLPHHGGRGSEKTEVQLVRLGPAPGPRSSPGGALWIVGLPGEPFTEYGTDFGSAFEPMLTDSGDRVLVCGYTNDLVGYLCTSEALEQGGYETALAHQVYHRPRPFSGELKSFLLAKSLELAHRMINEPPARSWVVRDSLRKFVGRPV